jgi:hypothetical protein
MLSMLSSVGRSFLSAGSIRVNLTAISSFDTYKPPGAL